MKLYNEFGDRKDEFEILAFHDDQVKDLADLDAKTERFRKEVWKQDIPFPILLDGTGETLELFGINAFPTNILIDRAGKVVKGDSLKMLREALERKEF